MGAIGTLPEGTRIESRCVSKVNGTGVRRDIVCTGDHLPTCEETDVGWICNDNCPVEDLQSLNRMVNVNDELIDVEKPIEREGLRVTWKMIRVSFQRTFVNGRCMKGDSTYSRETWHQGTTWTKWGARREINKIISANG